MSNNPRNWGGAVSLEVYRGEYTSEETIANLYINVNFVTGRVSEKAKSGLRFKLSLRRAEVCILKDASGTLKIPLSDIYRPGSIQAEYEEESSRSDDVKVGAKLGHSGASACAESATDSSQRDKLVYKAPIDAIRVMHRRNGDEHIYDLSPLSAETLIGAPWQPGRKILSLDASACGVGYEAPEPLIQIRCLREDLEISDIQYHGGSVFNFSALTKNKQVAVEAYIKERLALCVLHQEDLSDPYATIVIADAVPELS